MPKKIPSCKKLLRMRKVTKIRNSFCNLFKGKEKTKCKKLFDKEFINACNKKTRKNKK